MAKARPLHDRLCEKLQPSGDCLLFTGCKDAFGYGKISTTQSRFERTHRVAWEFANGKIPDHMCVLHKCDVPACCNPDHLFLGTRSDNSKDRAKKERANKKLSKYDVNNIKISSLSNKEIATQFCVSESMILQIKNGKRRNTI